MNKSVQNRICCNTVLHSRAKILYPQDDLFTIGESLRRLPKTLHDRRKRFARRELRDSGNNFTLRTPPDKLNDSNKTANTHDDREQRRTKDYCGLFNSNVV